MNQETIGVETERPGDVEGNRIAQRALIRECPGFEDTNGSETVIYQMSRLLADGGTVFDPSGASGNNKA